MIRNVLALVLFLMMSVLAVAQDRDLDSVVDYKVNKMQRYLKLTDTQATAIRPIIKDYFSKRSALLQEVAGEGIIDHVAVKSSLKSLKDNEYQQLSKIISDEQLKKWINKEILMATLNPDNPETSVDDDTTLTASGANFKF